MKIISGIFQTIASILAIYAMCYIFAGIGIVINSLELALGMN